MQSESHWNNLYRSKRIEQVSWYQPHLETSLALIRDTQVPFDAPIIDVGAGASTLVDDLLAQGYSDVTALDLSSEALAAMNARLGPAATRVTFVVGNIIEVKLPARHFLLWHDRAAFHFFTDLDERQRYVDQMRHAMAPGGYVILATFGPQGPERCSGLPTSRYGADDLGHLLGGGFRRVSEREEQHVTPAGVAQQFVYSLWTCTGSTT